MSAAAAIAAKACLRIVARKQAPLEDQPHFLLDACAWPPATSVPRWGQRGLAEAGALGCSRHRRRQHALEHPPRAFDRIRRPTRACSLCAALLRTVTIASTPPLLASATRPVVPITMTASFGERRDASQMPMAASCGRFRLRCSREIRDALFNHSRRPRSSPPPSAAASEPSVSEGRRDRVCRCRSDPRSARRRTGWASVSPDASFA